MSITTTHSSKAYTGTGDPAALDYIVDFSFFLPSDLEVFIRTTATGVEVKQVLDSHYTVSGGAGGLGTVTFVTTPAVSEEVHIRRVTPIDQQTVLTSAEVLPSSAIEASLDKDALRAQEARETLNSRALRIPATDIPVSGTAPDMELPSKVSRAVANAVLGFDAVTGDPTIVTGATLPSVTVSTFMATVLDDADAATAAATLGVLRERGLLTGGIQAGLVAALPVASAFGRGIYFATDSREIYYSNASAWTAHGSLSQFVNASLPAAATAGKMLLDTQNLILYRDTGSVLVPVDAPLPRGTLAGGKLTLSGTNTDVTCSKTDCRLGTSADQSLMNGRLSSPITKSLNESGWVAATGNAGRPSGDSLGANKWHHFFLIAKPDGTLDAGFDDSLTASNLLGEATGYTRYRRMGSVRETSAGNGTLTPFVQHGDTFLWASVPGRDFTAVDQDYTTQANVALSYTPAGVAVEADMVIAIAAIAAYHPVLLSHGGTTIPVAPDLTATAIGMFSGSVDERQRVKLWTNTSQQIVVRVDSDAAVSLHIEVHGFTDPRGRAD